MKRMNGTSIENKPSEAGHPRIVGLGSYDMDKACRNWLHKRGITTNARMTFGKGAKANKAK